MRIDRMVEGKLYQIKPKIHVYPDQKTGPHGCYRVIGGFRDVHNRDMSSGLPPFVYLGYKNEDWSYNYQHTSKIHYVLWQGDICVMDNQFAKHIIPIWDGEEDGQDG